MQNYIDALILCIIGAALLFGFTFFYRKVMPNLGAKKGQPNKREKKAASKSGNNTKNKSGESRVCPVCSAILYGNERVNSSAFPPLNGSNDRLMHIRGCLYCLRGDRDRVCPSCKAILAIDEIIICRLFERPNRHIHVHVLGCSQCRRA